MFIKFEKQKYKGRERTYLTVVETYRDINGNMKMRRVKSFGCLESHLDQQAFIESVKAEIPKLEEEFSKDFIIKISSDENRWRASYNYKFNFGYKYLEIIYKALKLDKYFKKLQTKIDKEIQFDISKIFNQ